MTPRERVLRTFRFEPTDRVAIDLMESSVWPELLEYFRAEDGLTENDAVIERLDPDFRWVWMQHQPANPPPPTNTPPPPAKPRQTYSRQVMAGPLADARTVADVEAHEWPDPACWQPQDYAAARARWPEHALVFSPGWMPLFWRACEAFGMEAALANMLTAPALFEAFVQRQHEFYLDILTRGLAAAQGHCDICWLGDDYASQRAMLMNPELWRRYIKPYLAKQVRLAREHGLYVLFHSCGSIRPILGDLIDIGVNAHLVFQTTAADMDAESISREFGGRLAFYGGIDVQQLLSFGSPAQVAATVQANVRAFADHGGYVVANSHHNVKTIKGANVLAMFEAAKACSFPLPAPD